MELSQLLIILFSLLLVLWYIGANMFNRRRGIATFNWLKRGLQAYGKIKEAQWLGTSGTGAKLSVEKANQPFRKIEAGYLLETREILPWWLFMHITGRRDELALTAWLRSAPKHEVEVGRINDQDFKELASTNNQFSKLPAPDGFIILCTKPELSPDLQQLSAFLVEMGPSVQRISLRKKAPHLVFKARVKPMIGSSPDTFLSALETWLQL
jgi:hypothetical protein